MIFFDIDTQHDFMDRGGALYTPDSEAIKPNIEQLLRAASEYRITTISSRCAHVPDDPEFAIFPPHCIDGTYGAERIFPDLPKLPRHEIPLGFEPDQETKLAAGTHYIVKKQVFDLFSNPWLEGKRQAGAFRDEDCVLFGVATDYCVLAAGRRLTAAAARVLVVEDAIRGVATETTVDAIAELRAAGVEFSATDEVLKRLIEAR